MENRLSSSSSSTGTLASDLAQRRAKKQSYFDKYPERKGQGPIVPSATLTLPQAKSSAGSSSRASSYSSSSTSRTSFDQQASVQSHEKPRQRPAGGRSVSAAWSEAREKEYDDGLARHWHTRKVGDGERKAKGADAQQPARRTPSPQSSAYVLPAASTSTAPQTETSPRNAVDAALEIYRARTVAASSARSSLVNGSPSQHVHDPCPPTKLSPPARKSPSLLKEKPLPTVREASSSKATTSHSRSQPEPSKPTPVLSINDIIRRHAPDVLSSSPKETSYDRPSLGSGSSSYRAPIASLEQDDESDGSSIGSIEREARRSTSLELASSGRKAPPSSLSPALQAALLRPIQANDRPQRESEFLSVAQSAGQNSRPPRTPSKPSQQFLTPSVSAPMLSTKKSIPKLFMSPRRRQVHQKSTSGCAESALDGISSMARSSSASLAKSATEASLSGCADEKRASMTRAKSTFDLRTPHTTPLAKLSLPTSANGRETTVFTPMPLTPPFLRHSKTPSPVSAASDYSNDDYGNDVRRYVQSAELTRLMTLTRAPYEGKTVSIADVGDVNGQAVVVFLGLGAVRYLIGLYTEMAVALGVRLICVDRWGMGRTDDVPSELRGVLEWSNVIAEVADRLDVARFSIMAHSAGAPYAMATALVHAERVVGPVHLLAPWVSPALETGYKWLRYVPDGVIRTAQAAEWRVQGWKLGASATPKSAVESPTTTFFESEDRRRFAPRHSASGVHLDVAGDDSFESDTSQRNGLRNASPSPSLRSLNLNKGRATKGPIAALQQRQQHARAPSEDTLSGLAEHADMLYAWQRAETVAYADVTEVPPCTPAKDHKVPLTQRRPSQPAPSSDSASRAAAPPAIVPSSADLPTALLRASHAESGGSTNDLLVILGRASQKPWGFNYTDVRHAVRVWHGDKDERVGVASVLWMEREMFDCRLTLVKGANHGLMTNVAVVVEVLESIASFRNA